MNTDTIAIGKNIRKLRRNLRLTQSGLGVHCGIKGQMISKIELGLCLPSVDVLIKLSDFFQISTDALLMRNISKKIQPDNATNKIKNIYTLLVDISAVYSTKDIS